MTAASRPARDAVRQHVAATLRAALITGELAPGAVYSAPALARELEVSATPVREAMLDLVRDGMVEVVPNTGFRVTEVTPRELDQITEARLLLEVPTMGAIAAASGSAARGAGSDGDRLDAALAALEPIADAMVAAAERLDLTTYLALDTDFHTSFLALHGNDQLVDLVRRLRERSRLRGLRAVAEAGDLAAATREHHAMIEAARDGDRDRMERLVRRHIGHVRTDWGG